MATQEKIEVVEGCSKMDLMLALFDSRSGNRRYLCFTLGNGREAKVSVVSVGAEDGSGESWNIEGFLWKLKSSDGFETMMSKGRKIKMYFSTKNRKGMLTILESIER